MATRLSTVWVLCLALAHQMAIIHGQLELKDVRDYVCTSSQVTGFPPSFCLQTCSLCTKGDEAGERAWCPSASVRMLPDVLITDVPEISNFNTGTLPGALCWPSFPVQLKDTKTVIKYKNVTVQITIGCQELIGIPQWTQCDVPGYILLVAPLFVIFLLIICICTCVCCFCPCCCGYDSDSPPPSPRKPRKKSEPGPKSKPEHVIFSNYNDMDMSKFVNSPPPDDDEVPLEEFQYTEPLPKRKPPNPPISYSIPPPPPSEPPPPVPVPTPVPAPTPTPPPKPPTPAPTPAPPPKPARTTKLFTDDGLLDVDALDNFFT